MGGQGRAILKAELARHRVSLAGVSDATRIARADDRPIALPKPDPANPDQIGNMTHEAAAKRSLAAKGDAGRGERLSQAQRARCRSSRRCRTDWSRI